MFLQTEISKRAGVRFLWALLLNVCCCHKNFSKTPGVSVGLVASKNFNNINHMWPCLTRELFVALLPV